MRIFTIGFTKKSAERFFTMLRRPGLVRVVDVRRNNVSQLAGFTKRDDLRFFLREICGVEYVHAPHLAPTQEIMDEYRKNGGDWSAFERMYLELIDSRRVDSLPDAETLDGACLLCSEAGPERCHRRLAAEYYRNRRGDVVIEHL